MNVKGWLKIAALSALAATAGCSSPQAEPAPAIPGNAKPAEPVTLKIFRGVALTDQEFQKLFVEPVKSKFPNISLELIVPGQGTQIENLIASGNVPDLVILWNGLLAQYKDLGLVQDMTKQVAAQGIDLGKYEPLYLNSAKVESDKGELYGLPYKANFNALYYNKDIFDKFAVEYPKDGLTWGAALELTRKVTNNKEGIQYRGLDPEGIARLALPLSPNYADPKTNKATADNDTWRKVFQLTKDIYAINGNRPQTINNYNASVTGFLKDKTVAMLPSVNLLPQLEEATKGGLNWDIAQYPSYEGSPNIYGMVDTHVIFVTKSSGHQEAAMNVVKAVTSEEVQVTSVQSFGNMSPFKDRKFQEQFGQGMPFLKGKKLASIFKSAPAPAVPQSKYLADVRKQLFDSFQQYLDGKDLNSALREAQEKADQTIKSKEGK